MTFTLPPDPPSGGMGTGSSLGTQRDRRGSGLLRALGAAAAGLVYWNAFPGRSWWWLASPALAALLLLVRGRRARTGAGLSLVFGIASFLPLLHWTGIYVGFVPWFALTLVESLYLGAVGLLLPRAWRARGGVLVQALSIAGLWVGQEWLRSTWPFGGFPWARTAFSQADAPTVRWAVLGGAPLVSAVVVVAAVLLAHSVVRLVDVRRDFTPWDASGPAGPGPLRRALPALAGAVALSASGLLVPVAGDSLWNTDVTREVTGVHATGTAAVAAVQGDVPRLGLDFNAQRRAVLDRHVNATLALAAKVTAGTAERPQIVVWPENSSDIDPTRNADAAAAIQQATDAVGVPVVIGAVLQQPVGHVSNAAMLWQPTSSGTPGPSANYVKRHPAPFAEYIPYRSFFRHFNSHVDDVAVDFAPGDHVGVFHVGTIALGDVICYEVAYDSLVQDPVRAGANLLAVQTNNATFGRSDMSAQQLAMSRLRAVETGRSVVHVSTVGVSALLDGDGHVHTTSPRFTTAVLQADLTLYDGQTPAVRLGHLLEAVFGGLAALGLAFARRRPRRGDLLEGRTR